MKQNRYRKFLALPLLFLILNTANVWSITTSDLETSATTTLEDGATYVIANAYNGTYLMGELDGSWGKATTTIGSAAIFTAHGSNSGCYLTCSAGRLVPVNSNSFSAYDAGTSNNLKIGDSGQIQMSSNTSRILRLNTKFRWYTSSTGSIAYLYKIKASCSNKVALTKGSPSNGSFSLNKSDGSYDNCDNNFEVVVSSITPNSGYVFDEITVSGADGKHSVTGPDGSGNYTVSYTKGNNITSTINVTFKQACATPTFSPAAGTYNNNQSVTISTATGGATIYYTTNGSTPTTSSSVYSSAITVSSDNTTIKAIAVKAGLDNSSVGSATYRLTCATPTFSPVAGTYTEAQTVTISCTTTSATIYYTTDGSDPTTGSSVYSSPLTVSSTQTIKAIAAKSGYSNSAIGTAAYTIRAGRIFSLLTDENVLTSGDELVIVTTSGDYALAACDGTSTSNRGQTPKTYNYDIDGTNAIVYNDNGSYNYVDILTLGGTSSGWTLATSESSGYYLYHTGTSNTLQKGNSVGDGYYWTISVDKTGGTPTYEATINNTFKTTYNIKKNSSSNIFSAYTTAQTAIKIYRYANTSPTVTVGTPSGTSFSYTYDNGPSSTQTFTISGSNLTGNVGISAPSNYKIKKGSDSWSSSITLTPSSGTIASTTISIQLVAGLDAGSYNGNITFTNNDGLTISPIALTGTVSKANLNPSFGEATYTIVRDVSTSTTFTLTGVPSDYTGTITYSRTNTPTASARLAIDGTNRIFTAANYSGRWTVTASFAEDGNYNAKTSGVTCVVNAVTRDTYVDNVNGQSVTEEQRTDNGVDPYVSPALSDVVPGSACQGTKVHLIGWASQAFVTKVGNGTLTGADSDYTAENGFYAVGTTLPAASATTYYAVYGEEE